MATTSRTPEGRSADSRGFADGTPCMAALGSVEDDIVPSARPRFSCLHLRQFEEQRGDRLWCRYHRIMTGGQFAKAPARLHPQARREWREHVPRWLVRTMDKSAG